MTQAVSSPGPQTQKQEHGTAFSGVGSIIRGFAVPFLAVFTAVIIGSVFVLLAGLDPIRAYSGLLQGALGSDGALTRTLIKMAPLILSGLAVAFAFKGGLFNIGAQGQLLVGSLMAAWVGFSPATGVRLIGTLAVGIGLYMAIRRLPSKPQGVVSITIFSVAMTILSVLLFGLLWIGPFSSSAVPLVGIIATLFATRLRNRSGVLLVGALIFGGGLGIWLGDVIPTAEISPLLHATIALLAGFSGGAAWAFIPGYLKARTGAHEVITTIMLNYIASLFLEWVVAPGRTNAPPGPLAFCRQAGQCASNPNRTAPILQSAYLPPIYTPGGNAPDYLHLGVLIAIVAAILIWVLLYRTTFGFELRMVGQNPSAARYSGVKVARMTVLTMVIAGGLAGLAGAIQVQGVNHEFQTNQNLALGFDSIAVALLASNNPFAIPPSAFLFGALDAGSSQMQLASRVPGELIQVVQALILMFVAADQIIRGLYRIRTGGGGEKVKLSWGQR